MTVVRDIEDEHAFSDPEGFVDDIDDEELLGDVLSSKPTDLDTYENVVIVDNIPQIGPEKFEKLQNVLMKTFKKYGTVVNTLYPKNENGTLKGFVFVEYESPNSALNAYKGLNKFKLDAKHIFSLVKLSDIDKYCSDSSEVEIPQKQDFKDPGDLYYWLLDEQKRDMYAVVYNLNEVQQSNKVGVFFNSYTQPTSVVERPNWTETTIMWSPRGAYFTSIHSKGAALWGCENFDKINRFSHINVDSVDFSPCETYIVTLRNPSIHHNGECIIWEILSGQQKRAFEVSMKDTWPVFKWSHDGKYFARLGEDVVQVYETPSFGLLDKQSFKIAGVQSFEWSPKDNIFICWVRSTTIDAPVKAFVYEVPSRTELCSKSLFFVDKIFFFWHPSGNYCCARSDLKGKKGVSHFLNIFNFKSTKNIPVDVHEQKDVISQLAWEPIENSSRFITLHGEGARAQASLYHVGEKSGSGVVVVASVETQATSISWSPLGRYVALAILKNTKSAASTGTVEFLDCDQDEIKLVNRSEHYAVYGLQWDPSGRFLATYNNSQTSKHDNQVIIWTFQGRKLQTNRMEFLNQFSWRPRPPRLVTEEHREEVTKNFKKYQAKFELEDKMSQSKTSKELLDKRRALSKTFNDMVSKMMEHYENIGKTVERRDFEGEDELEEEIIEFVHSEEVTVVDSTEDKKVRANAV